MKQFLFVFVLAMFLFSCTKKEASVSETNPPANSPSYSISDYTQLTVGNYWVYNVYSVDTLGNETFIGNDSCYVKKDTVVKGYTYAVVVNSPANWSGDSIILLRDSSTCLIDQHGIIYFGTNNFNTILKKDSGRNGVIIYSIPNSPVNINVPMGTYTCYDYAGVATFIGINNHFVYNSHNYYAANTGIVEWVGFPYFDKWTCYEGKLLRAHVM